eukprot:scaffold7689_cov114-Isochrysis_galbana.AAC.2
MQAWGLGLDRDTTSSRPPSMSCPGPAFCVLHLLAFGSHVVAMPHTSHPRKEVWEGPYAALSLRDRFGNMLACVHDTYTYRYRRDARREPRRPARTIRMHVANAVRGGGRALNAPLLAFSPLAGASSWGVGSGTQS